MKFAPYSFSKLSTHSTCGRRFKYQYIDKIKQEDCDRTALLKGGAVHSILEKYPAPSSHKLASKYQHIADKFISTKLAQKYLSQDSIREFDFGLKEDFSPCEYSDKTAMFRGSVDFVAVVDDVLHLADWKTGKCKEQQWQNFNQLMFYAIYFFQRYPKINDIKISYVYIEHNTENDILLERKYLERYKKDLTDLMSNAESDEDFNKNQSKLCDWCPYLNHCTADC